MIGRQIAGAPPVHVPPPGNVGSRSRSAAIDSSPPAAELDAVRTADPPPIPLGRLRVSSLDLSGLAVPQNLGEVAHLLLTIGDLTDEAIRREYEELLETLIREMPETRFTLAVGSGGGVELIEKVRGRLAAGGSPLAADRLRVLDLRNFATVYLLTGADGERPVGTIVPMNPDNLESCQATLRDLVARPGVTRVAVQLYQGSPLLERLPARVAQEAARDPSFAGTIDFQERPPCNLNIWAQDATLVRGDQLVIANRPFRSANQEVPKLLALTSPEFRVAEVDFPLDGGNVFPTLSAVYVGGRGVRYSWAEHAPLSFTTPAGTHEIEVAFRVKGEPRTLSGEELIQLLLSATFPRQRTVIFGDQPAECFHIDLAFTWLRPDPITGAPRAVVGDPLLAKELLRQFRGEDPEGFAAAELSLAARLGPKAGAQPLTVLLDQKTEDLEQWLTRQVEALERDGAKVFRIPYLPGAQAGGLFGNSFTDSGLPWVTYNNVLLHGGTVFLPVYGIPPVDEYTAALYESLGYAVIRIPMAAIAVQQGAINCVTKVLERRFSRDELGSAVPHIA